MSNKRLHLFQGYGVELEYMIVDHVTMAVVPVTDEFFKKVTGWYTSDVDRGKITWSNELVLHVLELKSTLPEYDLAGLSDHFYENIKMINTGLNDFNARLMPGGAHPFMDPEKETFLWPHDNREVYELYNRIFNCRGHGWSNLQSTHINLPFYDDEEFARLHAAIRLILPILPAMAASSPVLDGKDTGFLDKRLDFYQKNQRSIPSVTGKVIPERVFSKRQYHKMIYEKMVREVKPHDQENILDPVWLNSRGAIARFDRGSIEIRLMDIQECPQSDLALTALVACALKMLVYDHYISFHDQQKWEVEPLNKILQQTIRKAEKAVIDNKNYLNIFGLHEEATTAGKLWEKIIKDTLATYPEEMKPWVPVLEKIIKDGTLATRLITALEGIYTPENMRMVYRELSDCLMYNEMFGSWVQEDYS